MGGHPPNTSWGQTHIWGAPKTLVRLDFRTFEQKDLGDIVAFGISRPMATAGRGSVKAALEPNGML